jgi:hypothetical protein
LTYEDSSGAKQKKMVMSYHTTDMKHTVARDTACHPTTPETSTDMRANAQH